MIQEVYRREADYTLTEMGDVENQYNPDYTVSLLDLTKEKMEECNIAPPTDILNNKSDNYSELELMQIAKFLGHDYETILSIHKTYLERLTL